MLLFFCQRVQYWGWEHNTSSSAAELAASSDDTCTDPCGPNRPDEAASSAADDDLLEHNTANIVLFSTNHIADILYFSDKMGVLARNGLNKIFYYSLNSFWCTFVRGNLLESVH